MNEEKIESTVKVEATLSIEPDASKCGLGEAEPSEEGKISGSLEQKSKPRGKRNKELGRKGEEAAARFLYKNGYEIEDRNWRCAFGEADIIARDEDCLVFVEVKTRKNCDKGFPSEAVDAKKRDKYEKIALAYLEGYGACDIQVRFDVISIVVIDGGRALIRHHINAF